ncbi:MAG: anthranilate phosphoribosyltransferase [Planctomycetota bacterium]|jgi:anthranilate phosphoribosyltransferase
MNLKKAIALVAAGETLSTEQAQSTLETVLVPGFAEEDLGQLLAAMADRGETADEILGAVLALRGAMVPFESMPVGAVDTCGTGGDGKSSFNISTATALVAAAAGAKVVKHGNRSVSSSCGSADLLEAAGVSLELDAQQAARVLEDCGMVFLFAPTFHPAMRFVAPVRQALGRRTLFNFVGPLCHPGRVERQLLGVSDASRVEDYGSLLQELGCNRGFVVHGADGADELTLAGENVVRAVGDAPAIALGASSCGLDSAPDEVLVGGDAEANLRILEDLLDGATGPVRDAVLLNSAATLLLAEVDVNLGSACTRAAEALDSGAARDVLSRLVQSSRQQVGGKA